MNKLQELKKHLKRGKVYCTAELPKWSASVDRHLDELVKEGTWEKLSQGLYYYHELSAFDKTPPREEAVVKKSFLKDDRFLLTSLNAYNALGVSTT